MAKLHWDMNRDIDWAAFDPAQVDPETLRIVKAACLVEGNARDYAAYLVGVFHDDPEFQQAALDWAEEEVQHGQSLGKWASLADPGFDFPKALQEYRRRMPINVAASASIRGSRTGELVSRCMVETGTSSYYTAIGDATAEPVLKAICRKIAADEHRHYKLFYSHIRRYVEREGLSRFQRLRVALSRIAETEDDELATAYFVGNHAVNANDATPYVRQALIREYQKRAFGYYREDHVERAVGMIFKACGFAPQTRSFEWSRKAAWWLLRRKTAALRKAAA